MSIRVHPSNKHCVAKRVKQFRLPAIKKEILRGHLSTTGCTGTMMTLEVAP